MILNCSRSSFVHIFTYSSCCHLGVLILPGCWSTLCWLFFSFISPIARYMCPVKFRKKWQPVTPMHDVDVRFNTSLQGKDSTLHLGWVFPPQILSHRVLVTNWDHVGPGDYDETPEVNDVHVMYNMSVAVVAWMSTWCCCCCRNLPPQLDMNILSMKIFFSANWKVLSKPVSS